MKTLISLFVLPDEFVISPFLLSDNQVFGLGPPERKLLVLRWF